MIDFRLSTALFGGTFDPVHDGHLHVAREVLAAQPQIKQFIFVPAFQSPGKQPAGASPEQRLAWLRKAAEPAGMLVWDTEIQRKGESFTVDTLEEAHRLGASAERLFWVLGADAYNGFSRWREPDRIRELARLLVVNRPGQSLASQNSLDLIVAISPHPVSSSAIRAQLAEGSNNAQGLPAAVKADLEKILPAENPYARKIR